MATWQMMLALLGVLIPSLGVGIAALALHGNRAQTRAAAEVEDRDRAVKRAQARSLVDAVEKYLLLLPEGPGPVAPLAVSLPPLPEEEAAQVVVLAVAVGGDGARAVAEEFRSFFEAITRTIHGMPGVAEGVGQREGMASTLLHNEEGLDIYDASEWGPSVVGARRAIHKLRYDVFDLITPVRISSKARFDIANVLLATQQVLNNRANGFGDYVRFEVFVGYDRQIWARAIRFDRSTRLALIREVDWDSDVSPSSPEKYAVTLRLLFQEADARGVPLGELVNNYGVGGPPATELQHLGRN